MKRILLVAPNRAAGGAFGDMFQGDGVFQGLGRSPVKATMAPVELATLAALTPPEFEVDIWDEAVSGEITPRTEFAQPYDLVGVTGYLEHIARMLEIREEFQQRKVLTVAGGAAVTSSPQRFRGIFDVIFLGEAEFTWPQFLREWSAGKHMPEYRQIERMDLANTPVPRWDKVKGIDTAYSVGGLQTSRGCPFDCEFCDVIHLYGRKPRHKPIANVIAELRELERHGVRHVLVSDDNFYGDPRYAKELLKELIPVNNSFERPLCFHTMITINVAKDEEMLRLISEANFLQLFIGVETPRKASLLEVHKIQNTRSDMIADIRRVQSYGILVTTLLMVGFDADDTSVFEEIYDFLQAASSAHYRLHLMQSLPGTPQTARLLKEGRVMELTGHADDIFGVSNVIPANMTREELFEGYIALESKLMDWPAFSERLIGAVRSIHYTPAHGAKKNLPGQERMARMAELVERIVSAPKPVRAVAYKALGGLIALKSRRTGESGGQSLIKLLRLIESLEPEARKLAATVLKETVQHAPWLVREIILRVAIHREYIRGLGIMRNRLRKRIALEKQPGYQHRLLASAQIPPGFKRLFKEQFTMTLNWLLEGLQDHRFVAEGLVRIWKDFVIRFGATFEKFEDYHIVSLRELTDRTIEQGNRGELSHTRSVAQVENLNSTQIRFLSEQVLLAVEQDLKSERAENLVNVTLGPGKSGVHVSVAALAASAPKAAVS